MISDVKAINDCTVCWNIVFKHALENFMWLIGDQLGKSLKVIYWTPNKTVHCNLLVDLSFCTCFTTKIYSKNLNIKCDIFPKALQKNIMIYHMMFPVYSVI